MGVYPYLPYHPNPIVTGPSRKALPRNKQTCRQHGLAPYWQRQGLPVAPVAQDRLPVQKTDDSPIYC